MSAVLYRAFNAEGELLYVGATAGLAKRLEQHKKTKQWWQEVANVTVEHFGTTKEALKAERVAIAAEHPRANMAGTPRREKATPADVGPRIQQARLAKGWTQLDLAERIGRSDAAVSTWEAHVRFPRYDTLDLLAEALGHEVGWFFGEVAA